MPIEFIGANFVALSPVETGISRPQIGLSARLCSPLDHLPAAGDSSATMIRRTATPRLTLARVAPLVALALAGRCTEPRSEPVGEDAAARDASPGEEQDAGREAGRTDEAAGEAGSPAPRDAGS